MWVLFGLFVFMFSNFSDYIYNMELVLHKQNYTDAFAKIAFPRI